MNLPVAASLNGRANSRKDDADPGTASGRPRQSRDKRMLAARRFASWVAEHQRTGGISIPGDDVFNVMPSLSNDFCVGIKDLRYYIGIPSAVMEWFPDIPWVCVAVDPATHRISFVSKKIDCREIRLPAFTLNFDVPAQGCVNALKHYHFLDLRSIELIASANFLRISQQTSLTLSIRVGDPYVILAEWASGESNYRNDI